MSTLITLEIDGSADQQGHILASDFLDKLAHLLSTLNGIDCIVGQSKKPTLNYRIVDASHSSPLKVTLQPIIRKNVIIEDAEHVERRHRRFFDELTAVRSGGEVSPDLDEDLITHLRKLVEGLGTDFSKARIYNTNSSIELDSIFEKSVRKLLDEEDASWGREEGMLETVNLHNKVTCWIYPKVGAKKIRCDFKPDMRDLVKNNISKYVRVEGMKFFRPHSPYPFRISVKDLVAVEDEALSPLRALHGVAPNATGELSTVDFIRSMRDEWE